MVFVELGEARAEVQAGAHPREDFAGEFGGGLRGVGGLGGWGDAADVVGDRGKGADGGGGGVGGEDGEDEGDVEEGFWRGHG